MDFTVEQQKELTKKLKLKLKEYFKPYQIRIKRVTIHFNVTSKIESGYHMVYVMESEINGDPNAKESIISEFLTDGKKICEILYPFVPKYVKLKNENLELLNQ